MEWIRNRAGLKGNVGYTSREKWYIMIEKGSRWARRVAELRYREMKYWKAYRNLIFDGIRKVTERDTDTYMEKQKEDLYMANIGLIRVGEEEIHWCELDVELGF